jgi:hypothetical protein
VDLSDVGVVEAGEDLRFALETAQYTEAPVGERVA